MKRLALAILSTLCACSSANKVEAVKSGSLSPGLSMSQDIHPSEIQVDTRVDDTLRVSDAQGREMLIMKAVKDENGEMVASDYISPAVVSARFRNVAERHGKVDLRFDVSVPGAMVESFWQLRLQPVLKVSGESTALEPIFITGEQYRKAQLRGYQRYERFLQSIVSDTTIFIRSGQLEIFLKRNLPQIYALKRDSSYVSDEAFASIYGVTEREAVEHYTDSFRLRLNNRRKGMTGKMYARYVKAPIVKDGLRLDSVITSVNGDIVYHYVQTIPVGPGVRKAEISLSGGVFEEDREVCGIPRTKPLTFYISSLSTLVDPVDRYLLKITERRVEANTACYIEFAEGSAQVDASLGNNAFEMERIAGTLEDLLGSGEFDMDSIVVGASCSPEGTWAFNKGLSQQRSEAVCSYYSGMRSRNGIHVDFIPRAIPEDWDLFREMVSADSSLTREQKESISASWAIADPDARERALSKEPLYKHLREKIYPHLRVVRFNFYMHRRGMVKDTVHTTVPDTMYMRGVQAIRDRDYKTAVTILRPYGDLNTAVAYCALDYNASAMSVLENLPGGPKVDYMKAIIHARNGEDRLAVESYLRACEADPSFVHRGNLDPEISGLKNKYDIIAKL